MVRATQRPAFWPARACLWLAAIVLASLSAPAIADPADINAAARGVVRVVIIARENGGLVPVTHGTGFAVAPDRVVTNAHVIREARQDRNLSIGIVPSDGEHAIYGEILAVSSHNDLALLAPTAPMDLPPLTISGNPTADSGAVTAVGYPMNVDRAQGLSIGDIFRAQPPVKSTGFLSGSRPSRDFDSLLHTAPIARGNSGGPLLDECGRVIGINSFGTESGSADAEFFFAVSTRELLPFLRAQGVTPQINSLPCRSLAELEIEERQRAERMQMAATERATASQEALSQRRGEIRRKMEFAVLVERENGMALAGFLLIIALAAGGYGLSMHNHGAERRFVQIGGAIATLAIIGAAIAWLSRPGFASVEERVNETMRREMLAERPGGGEAKFAGSITCVLEPQRSRATTAIADDLSFNWTENGCVNDRTQYGLADGTWMRIFVPETEAAVSVNRLDPKNGEYRVERYLLGREAMSFVRAAREEYTGPECRASDEAIRTFGNRQQALLSLLPERPNERLVYQCNAAP